MEVTALKAVDSLSHNKLMIKIQAYGIIDDLDWVNTYSMADKTVHTNRTILPGILTKISGVIQRQSYWPLHPL